MKKTVLIVGQKISTLVNYLEEHGFDYIVLKDMKRTKFPDRKFKKRILCDFSTKESVIKTVREISRPIHVVIATYEAYVLPAAWIAEALDLPGMPIASAEACTDKFLMRSLFTQAPEKISPDFQVIQTEEDVRKFAATHEFPFIIKPANLAKSLLVTKSDTLDELLDNYRNTVLNIQQIYRKYAPDRTPKILIEEFMEGSIHSVDAFVDADGNPFVLENIVDYQTGYDIGYDDNFHYSRILPSQLPTEEKASLRRCAEIGIRALGMKNSPAHIEIILTKDGPRIVEIGARNGGYRERMHKLANNIDITGAALAIAQNKQPAIVGTKDEPCAVLELFPKKEGVFEGILNEDRLRGLPSVTHISVKVKQGDVVGKSSNGYKMCACVILHNTDMETFKRDLAYIQDYVEVVTS